MTCRPLPLRTTCCVALLLLLAACGGGEVGGKLSGLATDRSVILANNDQDALELRANGRFVFSQTVAAQKRYEVTVQTQPVGQACAVSDGSGTIDANGDSVDTVRVACTVLETLTGTLVGLQTGAALTLANGSARLTLAADGPWAFAGTLADRTAYEVTVQTQPLGTQCVVDNASGVFRIGTQTNIAVRCLQ